MMKWQDVKMHCSDWDQCDWWASLRDEKGNVFICTEQEIRLCESSPDYSKAFQLPHPTEFDDLADDEFKQYFFNRVCSHLERLAQ